MKKEKESLYEGMFILSATLSEEARKKALEKIVQEIEERGGSIQKLHEMGRKRLAYEIAKKKEGFYYLLFFDLPTQQMGDLWQEYHLHEDLIRFTTQKVEKVPESMEFKPVKLSH